jgi:cytochrome P450
MKNPAAYKKLVDEIDKATAGGSLSQPFVHYSEAANLPYLSACIKEGMRVHPSVGFTLPRYVPKTGCELAGKWFRGGSRVGVNAAVIHFDKTIFGDDAKKFNPDRWFRPGADNMDKYMFQVRK